MLLGKILTSPLISQKTLKRSRRKFPSQKKAQASLNNDFVQFYLAPNFSVRTPSYTYIFNHNTDYVQPLGERKCW